MTSLKCKDRKEINVISTSVTDFSMRAFLISNFYFTSLHNLESLLHVKTLNYNIVW